MSGQSFDLHTSLVVKRWNYHKKKWRANLMMSIKLATTSITVLSTLEGT